MEINSKVVYPKIQNEWTILETKKVDIGTKSQIKKSQDIFFLNFGKLHHQSNLLKLKKFCKTYNIESRIKYIT